MAGPNLVLRVASDELEPQEWLVSDQSVDIGRGREAGVCLRHASVSRRHASLSNTTAGFELRDCQSTNGTFVNGRRIDQPQLVKDGDRLTFGDISLVVEVAGGATTDPPAVRTLMVDLDDVLAPTPPAIDLTPATPRDLTMPELLPVVAPPPPVQPPVDAAWPSEAQTARAATEHTSTLAQTIDQADALAAALRSFGAELQVGVWLFEHAGGRPVARAAIEQIRAAESQPLAGAPAAWARLAETLPTLRVLLETQLILVDLLRPSLGDLTHDDHLQTNAPDQ
jgi:pSer/pThr/pTyr-binding forkhead associated (FHA) protein